MQYTSSSFNFEVIDRSFSYSASTWPLSLYCPEILCLFSLLQTSWSLQLAFSLALTSLASTTMHSKLPLLTTRPLSNALVKCFFGLTKLCNPSWICSAHMAFLSTLLPTHLWCSLIFSMLECNWLPVSISAYELLLFMLF